MARATHRPAWSATCPQRMAIDSSISSLGLRRLFRRRTELHCACRACARGPRFPHQAERFETNDLAVRKCRRRSSFPVLEQGDLVCRDRDGHWGLVGGSHRRIGGRQGSTFRATWHCHSIRGGSRCCIFFSIENCEWHMPLSPGGSDSS